MSPLRGALQHRRSGQLLVDFNEGSYALWRPYPRFTISLDGRYEEVYPESTLLMVAAALSAPSPGQAVAMKAVGADYALLDLRSPAGKRRYERVPGWSELHEDSRWAIMSRSQVALHHASSEEKATMAGCEIAEMWNPIF